MWCKLEKNKQSKYNKFLSKISFVLVFSLHCGYLIINIFCASCTNTLRWSMNCQINWVFVYVITWPNSQPSTIYTNRPLCYHIHRNSFWLTVNVSFLLTRKKKSWKLMNIVLNDIILWIFGIAATVQDKTKQILIFDFCFHLL